MGSSSTIESMKRVLAAAGFEDGEWFGDWDLSPLRHDSPRVVALAR